VDIIEKQQRNIERLVANEGRPIERLRQYEPQAAREATTKKGNSTTPKAS